MAKSFHDLGSRAQVAVFAGLAVLTVIASWQLLIAPERVDLATRRADLERVRADVAKASLVARQLPQFQREVAALQRSLADSTASLPDEKDAEDVLRQLHDLAMSSALEIRSFTPKPMAARSLYAEWPIELGLDGGYHDLGRFFDQISRLPLLISVSNLHITASVQPDGKNTVTASCVATTFVFRRESLAPPRGTP